MSTKNQPTWQSSDEIRVFRLQVVVMPNDEVIYLGRSLGYVDTRGRGRASPTRVDPKHLQEEQEGR